MLESLRKLLIGASLFAGVSAFSTPPVVAATLSEIPLNAVTAQVTGPPTGSGPSPGLVADFRVNVASTVGMDQLDPNLKLTGFSLQLEDPVGFVFGVSNGQPALGWEASGNTFQALSPEFGIAPGASLGGFQFTARVSTPTLLRSSIKFTSVSAVVPEPTSMLLNTLALGTFLGTGLVLKRQQKIAR